MTARSHRLIPIKQMRERISVDSTSRTGLRWISSPGRAGMEAGCLCGNGYFYISFDGYSYLNSRVVFALASGVDPGGLVVDHIDRNPLNNDYANLRAVTSRQNSQNRARSPEYFSLTVRFPDNQLAELKGACPSGRRLSVFLRDLLTEAMEADMAKLSRGTATDDSATGGDEG